jgi:lantibiotic modifying enzyme
MNFLTDTKRDARLLTKAALDVVADDVDEALAKTASYILQTADYTRSDRLWPAHYLVFSTNPLSVAYGACGPALFLYRSRQVRELPADVTAWMLERPLSVEAYPPSLYIGLAGIAYTFREIGFHEKAEAVMTLLYQSPLLYDEANMLLGAAGWGLASLYFYHRTGKQVYFDWAVRAGEHLLQTAQHQGETCSWRCKHDGRVHYGFAYGASGIALFLAYLHVTTGRVDFRTAAVRAFDFDLANKIETPLGWGWRKSEVDTIILPYWVHGGAGIGSVGIRISHLLGCERYQVIADQIAEDTFVKYSVFPGLFEGLAGIGELMLDMYGFTGNERYRHMAFDIAQTILWFKINQAEGVAWPGDWLNRLSNDYSTGAAGIGLFLSRLRRPCERLFVDIGAL